MATCRDVIAYADDMLQRYHSWQQKHPEGTPCDLEPLIVLRGRGRRLLSAIRAGEPIPPEALGEMSEALAQFDLARLLYVTDNLGSGGNHRTPEADRRYGLLR